MVPEATDCSLRDAGEAPTIPRWGLMLAQGTACSFCNSKLSIHQQVLRARFCGEPCRVQHAKLAPRQICSICGRALSPAQYGLRACASPACLAVANKAANEASARREAEERRNRAVCQAKALTLRDQSAGAARVEEPETYRVIQIPHLRLQGTKPAEQRRLAFRDFLNQLISKLSVDDAGPKAEGAGSDSSVQPDSAPNTEALAVLSTACGLCQGFCCQNGGQHAYLSVQTIRRYMARHPGLRPDDVLDDYLACVGEVSMEGSCLFHGPSGCGLPREMRSDVCNRYYCEGLKEFQKALTPEGPVRVFLAATQGDTVMDTVFCDEHGSRSVPAPLDEHVAGA
jgi:hypothetical protein